MQIQTSVTTIQASLFLHQAIQLSNTNKQAFELVSLLVANGADVRKTDDYGVTALHLSACAGKPMMFKVLLEEGAVVNKKDYFGCTPLHVAAVHGHKECLRALVNAGADISATSNDGLTALQIIQKNKHPLDCAKGLETAQHPNTERHYHLEECCCKADCPFCLALGQDSTIKNELAPVHKACLANNLDLLEQLLVAGADANIRGQQGQLPIHIIAGQSNGIEVLNKVVEEGNDVNSNRWKWQDRLDYCCRCKQD